jgi:hypothetical protein
MIFQTGYSLDVSFAGTYTFMFKLYYSHNPMNNVLSQPFTVQVVDVCTTDQVVITPPTVPQYSYYIGTGAMTITMPPWTVVPSYCDYWPAIMLCGQLCQYVEILEHTVTVQIDVCGTLCTGNVDGDLHTVVIIVIVGGVEVTIDINVVIMNPCLHEDYFHIQEVQVPDESCAILDNCMWTHSPFEIVTTMGTSVHQICGWLQYSADLPVQLDDFVMYDANMKTFYLWTDDMSMLGMSYEYTVSVQLINYPLCDVCPGCCAESTGTITIQTPCSAPAIHLGLVESKEILFDPPYTTVWNPPSVIVNPPQCL